MNSMSYDLLVKTKRGVWEFGTFKDFEYKKSKRAKGKPRQFKSGFVTLRGFYRNTRTSETLKNALDALEKEVSKIYIKFQIEEAASKQPKEVDTKILEEKFWIKKNEFCLSCKEECKQSSKVTVIKCPQYKKLK